MKHQGQTTSETTSTEIVSRAAIVCSSRSVCWTMIFSENRLPLFAYADLRFGIKV